MTSSGGVMAGYWSGWMSMWISLGLGWGCLGGSAFPVMAQSSDPTISFPQDQIEIFAQIVLAMESHRVEAHQRSQQAEDTQTQDQIRREFIRKATEIITDHGMTVPDYNRIVLALQSDEGDVLKQQIEAQIRQIQLSESQGVPQENQN